MVCMTSDDHGRGMTTTALQDSVWRGSRGLVTIGLFSLAFMVAFEALAVVTVMPVVAEDLDGLSLYAVAFAAPVAVSILSRTVAAPWIDRDGPAPALRWGVAGFVTGLVVSGVAPTMQVFLVGRAVQGVGMGMIGVALYVVVAQAYPPHLRPRAMTVLTSAWMLPAVVGPALAGAIAHVAGWRPVFLPAPVLALVCLALTWRSVGSLAGSGTSTGPRRVSPSLAALVTAAVLLLAVAGQRTLPGWAVLLGVSLVTIVVTAPRLVPRGTWSGGAGLPSLVGGRSLLAAAYFSAESYVPLALVELRGMSTAQAGFALTAAALAWFAGSWLVAHPERCGALLATPARRGLVGAAGIVLGVLAGPLVLVPWIPSPAVALMWAFGGLGMGAAMSAVSVQVLDVSAAGEEGSNSAALQTAESITESSIVAVGSVVFALVLVHGITPALQAVFVMAPVVALLGLGLLRRGYVPVGDPSSTR